MCPFKLTSLYRTVIVDFVACLGIQWHAILQFRKCVNMTWHLIDRVTRIWLVNFNCVYYNHSYLEISSLRSSDTRRSHRMQYFSLRLSKNGQWLVAHCESVVWIQTGSNRRPPACKAGALPAELWTQKFSFWERVA